MGTLDLRPPERVDDLDTKATLNGRGVRSMPFLHRHGSLRPPFWDFRDRSRASRDGAIAACIPSRKPVSPDSLDHRFQRCALNSVSKATS